MARRIVRLSRSSGFTLVELLIVVAIIGVLSTIGVPTFKRMVQKSKKSEAKVNLGGLYTAEQAFFSEYGAYGNMINKVGFEVDGQNMIYNVGFPTGATCTATGAGGELPMGGAAPSPIGANLQQVFAGYYDGTGTSMMGRITLTNGCPATVTSGVPAASTAAVQAAMGGASFTTVNVFNVTDAGVYAAADATHDPNGFIASASGVIAPGVNMDAPAAVTDTDIWLISYKRNLVNSQDGVK